MSVPNLTKTEKAEVPRFGLDKPEHPLSLLEAETAIGKILDLVPESELPECKIETHSDGSKWAQFGGVGYGISAAKRNGVLDPAVHRRGGLMDLFQEEVVYRLDIEAASLAVSS